LFRADQIDPAQARRIRRRLLSWFRRSQRDLPWRHDRNPYHIWVSEVMLQQTQAVTVLRYFEPFLQRFPTIDALASADEQDVLRFWEGLGYYRRARNLHRAARYLAAHHRGRLPDDPRVLQKLPGIGRYILGALLSQAFDRRWPILEANSERVLCRLFAQAADPGRAPVKRWLWKMAEDLLPDQSVGDFNQALMELGAVICTPAEPHCPACPLAEDCASRRLGKQRSIPFRPAPPAIISVREVAIVIRRGPRVLLVQRPDHGRWAGMWEFPHGPLQINETHETAASRLVAELTRLRVDVREEVVTVRHSVTHHRIAMTCFAARYRSGTYRSKFYDRAIWVALPELQRYPFSAPQRRLARALTEPRQRRLF
jgi:A/G-specific adenine glycosylase